MATKAFDPSRYALQRAVLRELPLGTPLAHSHLSDPSTGHFPFNAFNPKADGRFAGKAAVPSLGGYYAGTTAACALWEADLRDVVGDEQGYVTLHADKFRHRRLSFVLTTRPLLVLDLMPSPLAGMVGNKAIQHRWSALTTIDKHSGTHAAAASLLAQIAGWKQRVDGFAWYSRQCGTQEGHPTVYAFYEPPASSADFVEDPARPSILLDSPAGRIEIDRALALANLARAHSGAGVGALLAPPTPDDEP